MDDPIKTKPRLNTDEQIIDQKKRRDKFFRKKIYPKIILGLIISVIFVFWQTGVNNDKINEFLFSSPIAIIKDIINLFATGEIYPHIWATLYASLLGLFFGTIGGVIVAFIFGNINFLAEIFDPLFVGFNGLPKLALGPLFIIWFGIGMQSKIIMAGIMVFFLVFFNAFAGFRDVDVNLIDMMKILGANRFQIIAKLMLPAIIPWIIASLRSGIGIAVTGAIVGEYLGATQGLGWMVQSAGGVYNITRVFSCIFILMFMMGILDSLVKYLEKVIIRWK